MKKYSLAVAGATGLVGQEILKILEEKKMKFENIYLLASQKSKNKRFTFQGKELSVIPIDDFDFRKADYAVFSIGSRLSKIYTPKAYNAGCIVIDNSKAFRYQSEIPLIVPEVNWADYTDEHIIANPNCSTIQLVMALRPIQNVCRIKRVIVSTYQAVSGAGKKAVQDFLNQTENILESKQSLNEDELYSFNVIPQIDEMQENGFSLEEMKLTWETQKILNAYDMEITATAVRVPVIRGHSESVYIETYDDFDIEDIIQELTLFPGNIVVKADDKMNHPMPIYAQNKNWVYIGRVRKDIMNKKGFWLWIVSDNLRRGAALNAVLILEKLMK